MYPTQQQYLMKSKVLPKMKWVWVVVFIFYGGLPYIYNRLIVPANRWEYIMMESGN